MIRAAAIARAALIETARSRVTPVAVLVLLAAVPALTWLFGDDAATRDWMTRLLPAEGLRVLMPLAAIVGGAFLLRPSIKRGWAVLPARRAEWFAGTVIAGICVLVVAALVFSAGAMLGGWMFGTPLANTSHAGSIQLTRVQEGVTQQRHFKPGEMAVANPLREETLWIELPDDAGDAIAGEIEFLPIWTQELPPQQSSPVALWLEGPNGRAPVELKVESRRRVSFHAAANGAQRLILQPVDPALLIGTSTDRVRFTTGESGVLGSLAALLVLGLGATLLCLCAVLMIRGLSTAPTAALAGLLLMAALTLLPSLAPAQGMARARRADVQGVKQEPGLMQRLEDELDALPQLFPDVYFDEFLAGRTVPAAAWGEGLARLGIGLLLLVPGAWLFTRRQIAR
ncbi:MAG: hypothetical protein IPK87_10070 [Planctomycetes bacterium]|nr:hypothetical protein [Planctomycetota bacterium]